MRKSSPKINNLSRRSIPDMFQGDGRFDGVCLRCPGNPHRFSPGTRGVDLLPPFARRGIDALARCRELSPRERDVLILCCMGEKNSTMAKSLGISVSAVRRHLRNLHRKTSTADKAELILNLWHSCQVSLGERGGAPSDSGKTTLGPVVP